MARYYFFLALVLAACQKTPKDPCTHFEGNSLSLPYHIAIGKELSRTEKKTVQEIVQKTFQEIDAICNHLNPDSEISRLNQAPAHALMPISPRLQDLLTLCNQIVTLSGGRFDPTIEPLERVWRESLQQKKAPGPSSLQTACDALGWNHISLKNGIFRKSNPATRLDLAGISKGLCVDWIAERLLSLGYADFLIEWSGQIRASGNHPQTGDWIVQINPHFTQKGQPLPPIRLQNKAIAISGDTSHKNWTLPASLSKDGETHHYFPIIDPLTAQPLEKTEYSIAFATVIAPTCALADALATAAMLFSSRKEAESWAQEVVELHPEVSFWILSYK